jgi:hypothetical protein
VKKQFGLTRKILRVGKAVEHIKAASIASDAKGGDQVLKYCAVGRQLGYAGYMALDHLTVVRKDSYISWSSSCVGKMYISGGGKADTIDGIARRSRHQALLRRQAPPARSLQSLAGRPDLLRRRGDLQAVRPAAARRAP